MIEIIGPKGLTLLFLSTLFILLPATAFEAHERDISDSLGNLSMHSKEFRKVALSSRIDIPITLVEKYYDLIGPSVMLDILEENPTCHDLAHNVGILVFYKMGNLEGALQVCKKRCNDACFHGVLMGLFSHAETNHTHISDEPHAHVSKEDFEKTIVTLCDTPPLNQHYEGDCYHGIGHVSTFVANYDIKDSITFCKNIQDKMGAYACATGAYMEFIDGNESKERLDVAICDDYDEFPAACYRHAMLAAWGHTKHYRTLVDHCLNLDDSIQRSGCFHGLGYGALHSINKNPRLLSQICLYGSRDDQRMCLEGGASKVGIYNKTKQLEACSFVLDRGLRRNCLEAYNLDMDANPNGYYVVEKSRSLFSIVLAVFGIKVTLEHAENRKP